MYTSFNLKVLKKLTPCFIYAQGKDGNDPVGLIDTYVDKSSEYEEKLKKGGGQKSKRLVPELFILSKNGKKRVKSEAALSKKVYGKSKINFKENFCLLNITNFNFIKLSEIINLAVLRGEKKISEEALKIKPARPSKENNENEEDEEDEKEEEQEEEQDENETNDSDFIYDEDEDESSDKELNDSHKRNRKSKQVKEKDTKKKRKLDLKEQLERMTPNAEAIMSCLEKHEISLSMLREIGEKNFIEKLLKMKIIEKYGWCKTLRDIVFQKKK